MDEKNNEIILLFQSSGCIFGLLVYNFYWGIFFLLFLRCRLQRSPVVGGTAKNLFSKSLLDALSQQTETQKISTTVKN